ncbi:hypothetical protein DICPUDRAFT_160463 [Dictyostelium purpureum]|uniref:Homeobox domain-containing protein n=1 Tax=Dictyostelium purpureum TaxID=5786 RepID=F1A6D1_DICPU|nr:uncharacterized protein DICPUDRAFT_160463 [Dictyostelium purpureum]EGC28249.1 hypothetical protein DICPUDRAFT_160463 [Dictyostelium purpureum]|eukprot:XP_003295225.1 hypothetical protein DICPUDRAFT_160463 [Dictyostelium purpureum]
MDLFQINICFNHHSFHNRHHYHPYNHLQSNKNYNHIENNSLNTNESYFSNSYNLNLLQNIELNNINNNNNNNEYKKNNITINDKNNKNNNNINSNNSNESDDNKDFVFVHLNKVKKTRSKKTREHKEELELCFKKNPFPDAIEKEIIAYQLDMSVDQIITWFKHKRESLKKANNLEYKEKCIKKFTKTTKELNYFFYNSPFPSNENIEYFAFNYGVPEDKIQIWFKSKRHSLRETHVFLNNKAIDKKSLLDNNLNISEIDNNVDKINLNESLISFDFNDNKRKIKSININNNSYQISTFDSTVYKINISDYRNHNKTYNKTNNNNNNNSDQDNKTPSNDNHSGLCKNNSCCPSPTLLENNKLSINFINN